jgi:protein O-GlcNAc transferase
MPNDVKTETELKAAAAAHRGGRTAEARAVYERVLAREPGNPDALHLLGLLERDAGRLEDAAGLIRRAVRAAPRAADLHINLGGVLKDLGRPDEALACLRRAAALRGDHPQTYNNLAVVLRACGQLTEAAEAYRRAADLLPGFTDALSSLASVREEQGRADLAIACRREALAAPLGSVSEDARARVHSDLLLCLQYTQGHNGPAMLAEHRAWARRYAEPLCPKQGAAEFTNDPAPGRRLRVGLVSSDFRSHPMARFLEPVMEGRQRDAMEIYCYSDVSRPDSVTARLKHRADVWRDAAGVGDGELASQIRRDGVDVLVDLNGHMPGHRLAVFARRAAPVQVSAIGYPGTTGLETMDFRLTDVHHDNKTDAFHTEKLLRLPDCAWCWRPDPDGPEVTGLPAARAGRATLGCLNRLVKLTPRMAGLWARVLAAVPGSRLVALVPEGAELGPSPRGMLEAALRPAGVAPDRVVLLARRPRAAYMRLFQDIDLALDTFPYAGQTTTCDAMWMGVPTVTQAGPTHVSRTGVSLLRQVGLEELIADCEDDYVERAVRLREIRQTLRERMRHSPLMDAGRIAVAWEQAFRSAWRAWCNGR